LEGFLGAGEIVPVRYDPADHSKMTLDLPALQATLVPRVKELDAQQDAAVAEKVARTEARISGSEQIDGAAQTGSVSTFVVASTEPVAPGGDGLERWLPDVADQLSKLADLRDRGVLTEAEFEAQKAKLLSAG
jgi:hypothetical protein